jgi:PRTRC genetic system protein B
MQVTTEIGDRRKFVLAKALLIYEEQVYKREQFATVHDVVHEGAEPQQARIGPGNLLTVSFLRTLCAGLEGPAKAVLLPENVLAYTSDLLIWWTPPRLHAMFFSDGAEDRAAVNGRICPHPSLVWKVHRGRLYLRALTEAVRPSAATPLMVAPYWNTEVTRGDVCEGDMPRPAETTTTTMLPWEEGFFNSRFTHPSGVGQLTVHPGGFMGLWTELASTQNFPTHYLTPANQTLEQFAGEGRGNNSWDA